MAVMAGMAVGLVLWPGHAEAQQRIRQNRVSIVSAEPEAGIRGGYDFRYKAAVLGGQVKLPLGQALDLMPSADYFFGTAKRWEGNADAAIRLGKIQGMYAGGGWHFGRGDHGPSVFFGLEPRRRLTGNQVHGYLETRWIFEGPTRFQLLLGLNLALGARRP